LREEISAGQKPPKKKSLAQDRSARGGWGQLRKLKMGIEKGEER